MADTAQIIYEYASASTVSLFTDTFKFRVDRPGLSVDTRVDGTRVVTDTSAKVVFVQATGVMSGDDVNTLYGVQTGTIVYTGKFPRLTTINLDGDTTITNLEVACTLFEADDIGFGKWAARMNFESKDQ